MNLKLFLIDLLIGSFTGLLIFVVTKIALLGMVSGILISVILVAVQILDMDP